MFSMDGNAHHIAGATLRPWSLKGLSPRRLSWTIVLLTLMASHPPHGQAQSLQDLLAHAPPATAPSTNLTPQLNVHPLMSAGLPSTVRTGSVELSDGRILRGTIWTTPERPFRIWLAGLKRYRDIDVELVKSIQAQVLGAHRIRQWRWQQEGSDIKLYSGKTKPRLSFAYRFTLIRGKPVTGTLDAPLFVRANGRKYNLILYKRLEGTWGEKLSAVVYVKKVELQLTPQLVRTVATWTRQLPLVPWRTMLARVK